MSREVNPNRKKAKQLFIEHVGNITNRKIAEMLGEDEKKVAVWKQRDNWTNAGGNVVQQKKDNKKNVVQQKKKSTSNGDNEPVKNDVKASDRLTIKQEKFVQGLMSGLSQREAYKQAYDCGNMTDTVIDVKACELANNGKIVVRIKELTDELKERNMVTIERTLAELAKIGFADIKDFLEFRTEKTLVGHDNGKPIFDYKNIVEAKPSDQIDGTLINEVSIGKDGTFKFKLHSKDAALEKIGKHLKMFTDKVEHTGKDGGAIEINSLTDEEIDAKIQRLINNNS